MRQKVPQPEMSIGELASRVGVRASALRYYEREGLLSPADRVGGRRRYDGPAVSRVLMIRFCQQLGFTLAEIRRLVTPSNGRNGKQEWRDLVDVKLVEVDDAIAQAQAVKRLLEESRDCECVSPDSCRFLERVDLAASPPWRLNGAPRPGGA